MNDRSAGGPGTLKRVALVVGLMAATAGATFLATRGTYESAPTRTEPEDAPTSKADIAIPVGLSPKATARWRTLKRYPILAEDPVKLKAVRAALNTKDKLQVALLLSEGYGIEIATLGKIPVMWITPEAMLLTAGQDKANEKVIFYIHGGAFILQSMRSNARLNADLADAVGARVCSVEYSLSPEAQHPIALNEVFAAYRALLRDGYRKENVVIFGTSAGGALALSLALKLKASRADLLPAGIAVASPGGDAVGTGDSFTTLAAWDPQFTVEELERSTKAYVGDANPRNPLVSPVFGNYAGMPPMFLCCGSREILMSNTLRIAANAQHAGVPVTLRVADGLWHVPVQKNGIPEFDANHEVLARFLSGRFQSK